ncbi:hypothetical protein N0V83_009286 [Neocucurbitaria cava]|uniref:Heterokaryon incompatibility domain-containing protein n=1 Tax=Neocucurbitaria cava TaxID=798079 RepID=A0A9W8Y0U3_9PLEO|nr:hypothetical protein N0V83_009286 [Neocucurbitaria cava]
MGQQDSLLSLHDIWCEDDLDSLSCCSCGKSLQGHAIVRTFHLYPQDLSPIPKKYSRITSALKQQLVFFDRHMECCSDVDYVAISHVWNTTVSDTHVYGRTSPPALAMEACDHILAALGPMNERLSKHLGEHTEIWYDYISVPQWENDLKVHILRAIPDIFHNAQCTVVHLDDVGDDVIRQLRHGVDSREVISGITGVCNAKWFKRVWTVMEYVRSKNVKVLNKNFQIVEGIDDVFIGEVHKAWEAERKKASSVHVVEKLADMGKNLVPWNLGPLALGRRLKLLEFGQAFGLLSRRGCRSSRDFFHALLGIVRAELHEPLEDDEVQATLQIATACLKVGDYSPLLMVPRSKDAFTHHNAQNRTLFQRSGYHDVLAYGLGPGSGLPTYHSSLPSTAITPSRASLKLERIGTVTYASKTTYPLGSQIASFLQLIRIAMNYTGPNALPFVHTVAGRLYNVSASDISSLLADKSKMAKLQGLLDTMYNINPFSYSTFDVELATSIADVLGVSRILPATRKASSPLAWLYEHGGTMHNGDPASVIAAQCGGCQGTFVYRAGLHRPSREVFGAVAWRIGGVRYEGINEGGG